MIHPPVCDHAYEIWLPCETPDAQCLARLRACDTSIGMPLGCATHLWHALLHIPLPPASINTLINALSRSTVWPPQINRGSNMCKELVVRIKISLQKKSKWLARLHQKCLVVPSTLVMSFHIQKTHAHDYQ